MPFKRWTILYLLLLATNVFGQYYEPAKPVASKILIKNFFDAAMVYPSDAYDLNKSGKVEVTFKIDTAGFPFDFHLKKSVFPSLDREAIRLISLLIWFPSKKNGVPQLDQKTMSLTFNKRHYQRIVKERGYELPGIFEIEQDTNRNIYNFAALDMQALPLLPDSTISLKWYVQQQLQYPEAAAKLDITGTVRLDFVIETDGIVSNIQVTEAVGGGCDQEAIRILQSIRWKPGIRAGMAVRSHSYLHITFKLEDARQQPIPNRQASGL
ncbi:MAG: energy transducer TonB [Bacteroidales bacterium]|jgi:protein TonB|nr:energy transducer TonB [Bacteroidales bacterium]MDD3700284.1 energy transducer TonB [Bacteroidales bacterium]MDY0368514.1 energy transducer TonB [Bacteroidales bacterium]